MESDSVKAESLKHLLMHMPESLNLMIAFKNSMRLEYNYVILATNMSFDDLHNVMSSFGRHEAWSNSALLYKPIKTRNKVVRYFIEYIQYLDYDPLDRRDKIRELYRKSRLPHDGWINLNYYGDRVSRLFIYGAHVVNRADVISFKYQSTRILVGITHLSTRARRYTGFA